MKRARFRMEKKFVVQVRYYEYMYVIRDERGDRIYTGTDKKLAETTLKILNTYRHREDLRKRRTRPARKRRK